MSEIPADELLRRSEAALRAENETLRKMAADLQDEQIALRAEVKFLTGAAENAMLRKQHLDERASRERLVVLAQSAVDKLHSSMYGDYPDVELVESAMSDLLLIRGVVEPEDDEDE